MSNKLKVDIITSDSHVYKGEVNSVLFNTFNGKIMLNALYASTIGTVSEGDIVIDEGNNQKISKLIGEGIYIISENSLKILVDYCFDNTKENIDLLIKQQTDSYEKLKSLNSKKIIFKYELTLSKSLRELREKK